MIGYALARERNANVRRTLFLLCSVALVLILAKAAGFHQIASTWKSLRLEGVLLSVACYYASLGVRVATWKILLGNGSPSTSRLLPPLALGFILGHLLPAKTGEPLTAVLLARTFRLPLGRALAALASERGLQLLVLLATFTAAAAWTAGNVFALQSMRNGAVILLGISMVGIFALRPGLRLLRGPLEKLPKVGPALRDSLNALEHTLSNRRSVVLLSLLTGVFWGLQYLSLWAMLNASTEAVTFPEAAVVAGAAILGGTLTLLPLGTQDGISAAVLNSFGVPLGVGFSLALAHTALSFACGALVLAFLPFSSWSKRAADEDSLTAQGNAPRDSQSHQGKN